ncbi:MAG: hypothetical protein R3F49_05855 [Planctomycetota bacterium]
MWNLALVAALAAAPAQDLVTLQHAPLTEMLRHPKDAGLARLIALAPVALERFMAEQGEQAPPGLIELAVSLLTSGKALSIGTSDNPEMPFRATLAFDAPDAATAARREELLGELMLMAGISFGAQEANGLKSVDTPMPVPVALGTLAKALTLTIGTDSITRPAPVAAGMPRGVTPWLEMHQSADALRALFQAQGNGAEAEALLKAFNASDVNLAFGSDGKRSWWSNSSLGSAAMLRAQGAVPDGGLPLSALARIPEDAVFAVAMRLDWAGIWATIEAQAKQLTDAIGQSSVDLRTMMADELGFDLVAEVLPHFGPTTGMYMSDTTGGGALTSTVLFTEVRDAASVAALAARLVALIEEEAGEQVELRTHRVGALELTSVVFPGLPVPVSPTWVMDGGYLYIGLSPQAAAAAVEAARAGGGLPNNPRFRSGLDAIGHDASVVAVSFMDAPALLRDGYPYMTLAMDAVGNLARRAGEADGLGLMMPSLNALSRGTEASVSVTRIVGDDTLGLTCGDLSWTVNVTALVGLLDRTGLMLAAPLMMAGARSSSFNDGDWDEMEPMEWHEPLLEGGSLVALNGWMATDAVDGQDDVLAQLEVHLDASAGALSVYLVDADVTTFIRNTQESIVVTVHPEEGEPFDLVLRHVASDLTGESVGDSSQYRVEDARIQGWPYLSGEVSSIEVAGTTFNAVSIWCFAP